MPTFIAVVIVKTLQVEQLIDPETHLIFYSTRYLVSVLLFFFSSSTLLLFSIPFVLRNKNKTEKRKNNKE